MGKFDRIFDADDTTEDSLSPEEGVAAIAILSALANYSKVDSATLEEMLWESEIFTDYTEEDMSSLVEKCTTIANTDGLGALFNAAYESLSDDLVLDAFAVAVMMLLEDGKVPHQQAQFLMELQAALGLEEDEAEEIVDEVISEFADEDEFSGDESEEDEEYGQAETMIPGSSEDSESPYYESPIGNFGVSVPVDLNKGGRIDEGEATVGFSDDFGALLRIDYTPFPPEAEEEIQSIGQEEFLKSFLNSYVSQAIFPHIPGSEVLYEEYLEDVAEGAYFILVDMPQGSTISVHKNLGPGTRLDAYRGLISFVAEGFLYTVASQRTFWESEKPGPLEAEVEGLQSQIFSFIETIEFFEAEI